MIESLRKQQSKLCVIGLGYVGLPIALSFAKKIAVIGFDTDVNKINQLKKGIDPHQEIPPEDFKGCSIKFTEDVKEIRDASCYIVAVPTPIDAYKNPYLRYLFSACEIVGSVLQKKNLVIFESTVYPGCTEEECIPILEKISGLSARHDFDVGYAPERINPGDKVHTLQNITKVVAAKDKKTLAVMTALYQLIIQADIYQAPSIKVAEAAKIIENTQRDLNIALMNELSVLFKKLDINIYDVIDTAATKWNFCKFTPGLVGGHCIGVDPYYLTYKAKAYDYHAKIILSGRNINDAMSAFIAKDVVQFLLKKDKLLKETHVLIMGATFKENIRDVRNSKVIDLVNELKSFSVQVQVSDPHADRKVLKKLYQVDLDNKFDKKYDAVILAVPHQEYLQLDEAFFISITEQEALLYDVKGVFRNKTKTLIYKSL